MTEAIVPIKIRKPTWRGAIVGVLAVVLLAYFVPKLGAVLARLFQTFVGLGPPPPQGDVLIWLYIQHFFQMVVALLAIALVRRWVPTDYGLHRPTGRTCYRQAWLWGAGFGLLMLLVDYAPQLIAGTKPTLDYPLPSSQAIGWLFFEGVWVGPTEEIPFRALLVPLLMALWPARLRLGRIDMAWAGVVVALLFALLHANSFQTEAWPLALGQQIYAFALGVLYAYWLEKSRSIVAPIIGHNVSDVVEFALLFLWVGMR